VGEVIPRRKAVQLIHQKGKEVYTSGEKYLTNRKEGSLDSEKSYLGDLGDISQKKKEELTEEKTERGE